MKNKLLTIKDIAQLANVSISTVSRVLNNKDRVSKATKQRVKKIIAENEYKPNHLAVSMIKKTSQLIYIIVPDCSTFFYGEVIHGAEQVCKSRNYNLLVYATNAKLENEYAFFNNSFISIADGVICVPSSNDAAPYKDYSKPLVFVDRYLDDLQADSVVVENFNGAYLLTKRFIKNGHQNIAFISGSTDTTVGRDRLNGYRQAILDAGIPLCQENIYLDDWYPHTGARAMEQIISRIDTQRPTAVISGNSGVCIGVLQAAKALGLQLPADMKIVSFDDCDLARYIGITVLKRATIEMGQIAAEWLLDRIEDKIPSSIPQRITLPVSIINRDPQS